MIRATLQQLRVFMAVAEHQSFTRAAEQIHMTQPGVSIQVKRLEELLDTKLFEKLGNQIYLTPEGEALQASCRTMFDELDQFEQRIKGMHNEVSGPLRLGAVTTAKYFLPNYLGGFLRRYPEVRPYLKVSNRERISERLESNEDELYIMVRLPDRDDVVSYPFMEDQLVVFAHPEHPLVGQQQIGKVELLQERIISREVGSGIRQTVENKLAQYDTPLEPYMELGSGEAIKQAVMSGIGIGMLSDLSLRLEFESGKLVPLDVAGFPISRQWYVVHRAGKHLSRAARCFLEYLQRGEAVGGNGVV